MAECNIETDLSPEERLRCLISYISTVEIDPNVSAKLYYKSGLNMFKQFNVYYKESSWENALCIYLKYELLFFDEIKKHPEYSKIPVNAKSINATNFRLMKLKADHARRELFKQYKREYVSYCEELKRVHGKEMLDKLKALESSKASQTCTRPKVIPSKDFGKNLKKSSSDMLKSKTTGNKTSKHTSLNDSNQEGKLGKGNSEIFKLRDTNIKSNNNADQKLGNSQEPKCGSDIGFKTKKASIKSNRFSLGEQYLIWGSNEIFNSNAACHKAWDTVNTGGKDHFLWDTKVPETFFDARQAELDSAANRGTKGTHIYIRKRSLPPQTNFKHNTGVKNVGKISYEKDKTTQTTV